MAIKTEEEFISLVRKAEKEAQNRPKLYLFKLALFACFGYAVILLTLTTLLGLTGGLILLAIFSTGIFLLLVKKKLIFVLGFAIWVLIKALWVKLPAPTGYSLKRKDFPALFKELDSLSKQLDAIKVHEVILDRSYNAAVVQHPRLGVLGWNKNYLILGYQLLMGLSPEQMRAVLAHEFGHLSGNHSRFSGWIYRNRISWARVMDAFSNEHSWGGSMMRKFFNWYSPKFDAYSFALARSNEYEADAISAQLTSANIAGQALLNAYVAAPYVEQHYWDDFFKQADHYAKPQTPPLEGLQAFLQSTSINKEDIKEHLNTALNAETHYADTHPCLSDRLKALGDTQKFQLMTSFEVSAAQAWLGNKNSDVLSDFDQKWWQETQERWESRFTYSQESLKALSEFDECIAEELSDDNLWKFAYLTQEFRSLEQAQPLLQIYQSRYPKNSDAAYYIARYQMGHDLEAAMLQFKIARHDPRLIEACAHLGFNLLMSHNQEQEASQWWQECVSINQVFNEAKEERASVTIRDTLNEPSKDQQPLLENLIEQLKAHKRVKKVWIAEKAVSHYKDDPVYIVAFTLRGLAFSYDKAEDELRNAIRHSASVFIVAKSGTHKKLAKKVIKSGKRVI
jgi:Zn-dependent protease with chaperone function